ncbi:MAG TPA: methylated-DNA--[protein]-cysteine S-methyltransferase [Ideonella sp.]|uniref:methylated-DNA--[protein]-cysteine S-methyltransferase n=1 Tax=Ideonella sp. TaxID=1929293 RepID=UPI002E36B30A|nr:methylated-DNA--[protein]-cysteine S-methyltransferase [Ideonella sp.]HEX5683235.1 methylated-DNA--[protein]-cysteine S-methyltransferase [Ideonella sp.]
MSGFAFFDTPAGLCGLAWNDALEVCGGQLPEPTPELTRRRMQQRFPGLRETEPPPAMAQVLRRLAAALQGAPDTLDDVPLADADVPVFNRRVYALARQIPPGQTRSYGELAAELGGPAVARAVGQALGRNHFASLVPCHRVMAARHQAGGFSGPGGLQTKLRLLQLEGAQLGDQPGLF